MSRAYEGYQLRLPPELKDWVKATAQKNRRSFNSEITYRLEAAMRADQNAEPPAAGEASRA